MIKLLYLLTVIELNGLHREIESLYLGVLKNGSVAPQLFLNPYANFILVGGRQNDDIFAA